MRLGKIVTFLATVPIFCAAAFWAGYGAWLESEIPRVEIRSLTPQAAGNERALPFFELMSPLPSLDINQALPKLEYKKGPPERYLERITVLFQTSPRAPKERITYYGRRSRLNLRGLASFPDEPAAEARYIEAALRESQGEKTGALSGWRSFVYRPFLLREASRLLKDAKTVYVMNQAGTPAFFFESPTGEGGRSKASALFIRRNSFYRVEFLGDRGFSSLDPLTIFRKSFLTGKRADALAYVARNLSEVHLDKQPAANMKISEMAWPVLLLAAYVSIDPASIDTFFHFAGLNSLLYRSSAGDSSDVEISDALRNNVLASDAYARDIAPEAAKTAEIGRFARLLTRNFDQ